MVTHNEILLEGINPAFHTMAARTIEVSDWSALLGYMDSHRVLPYIHRHWQTLNQLHELERCFVEGYVMHNVNMGSLHDLREEIRDILDVCDPERLQGAGEPLPDGETFTLYRGGHPFGYSWSSNPDVAEKFGNISSITVNRDDVMFYTNEREEDEFFIDAELVRIYRRIAA